MQGNRSASRLKLYLLYPCLFERESAPLELFTFYTEYYILMLSLGYFYFSFEMVPNTVPLIFISPLPGRLLRSGLAILD
jgi:hypothetical protein